MKPTGRWRQLLDERLHEAVAVLGRVPGVHGFIVAGSLGRGEPWPMSDIDLLPIYASAEAAAELDASRSELVDWWAASGRAQTLDVGWLAFTTAEIGEVLGAGPDHAAALMTDRRWFHGVDKAYGGHAASSADELAGAFAAWITAVRFDPAVVSARVTSWREQAKHAMAEAAEVQDRDPASATYLLRESARALRLTLVEQWGERLSSMGREWTRFERMADQQGQRLLADRIAALAGADTAGAAERSRRAPHWLQERIDLCYAARTAIGEDVSWAENARDQLAAFTIHVVRHRPDLAGPWTGSPDPGLSEHLEELRGLIAQVG
jgi:predicted nucleotidyltransferase